MAKPTQTTEELLAEIELLKKNLAVEKEARSQAEELALAVAQSSPYSSNSEEQATGKSTPVEVCLNPWVKDESKQKFKTVEIPTYFYCIQLPAGAGVSLTTNGNNYYHGETYEVDYHTLVDLKSRVARCWDHEKSIHGDNENAYRKPTHTHLMSPAAAKRMGQH